MRRSKIYLLSESSFRELIFKSRSYSQVLRALNLTTRGGSSVHNLKNRIKNLNISTEHFARQTEFATAAIRQDLKSILIKNSTYKNLGGLKIRLVRAGLLKYECNECHLRGPWNNKPLVLVLDHKNGDNTDHRLENLQFLCPNCNSQTETFAGRNVGKL